MSEEKKVTLQEAYERGGHWKYYHHVHGTYYLVASIDRGPRDGKLSADQQGFKHPLCGSIVIVQLIDGGLNVVEFTTGSRLATAANWEKCNTIKLTVVLGEPDQD